MSNVIKASQISYSEDVRSIDMNERAEEIENTYMEQFVSSHVAQQIDLEEVAERLSEEGVLTPEDIDFEPGINAIPVTEEPGEFSELPEEPPVTRDEAGLMEVEARLREKQQELAEVQKSLDEAAAKVDRMIEDANAQATLIIDDAEKKAEERIEEALERAREEGLEQGRKQAEEENEQTRADLEALKDQYRADFEKQVDELEPAFVEIVIKYVKKLTGVYADDKKEIILHLIDNALKDKHGNDNFIIRVSEADYPVVSYSKDSIRAYLSEGAQLEVVADKVLERNQCMIETESRIFDCSLDGQLLSLIEDIRMLAEKE